MSPDTHAPLTPSARSRIVSTGAPRAGEACCSYGSAGVRGGWALGPLRGPRGDQSHAIGSTNAAQAAAQTAPDIDWATVGAAMACSVIRAITAFSWIATCGQIVGKSRNRGISALRNFGSSEIGSDRPFLRTHSVPLEGLMPLPQRSNSMTTCPNYTDASRSGQLEPTTTDRILAASRGGLTPPSSA